MENEISPDTTRFAQLFTEFPDLTPWIGNTAVGVSILLKYPSDGLFIPAKNNLGEDDTVAMVKVGYPTNDVNNDSEWIGLIVTITKASKYLLNTHWDYDFKDDNSPTEASLDESKNSRQPIDLSEPERYKLHLRSLYMYDLEKQDYVEASTIVKDIYSEHLKTLTNVGFRAKMELQRKSTNLIPKIQKILEGINYSVFGRKIRKTMDFSTGILKQYPREDLIDLTTEKTKLLGSDFPVTNQTARTFIFLTVIVFLINYWFGFDILGLNALIKRSSENSLFLAAIVATFALILDKVFPILIFKIINFLIDLNLKFMEWKIKT